MAFTPMGDFTFKHLDNVDKPNKSATQNKTDWDSRGSELRTALNAVVTLLNAVTDGASGADSVGMTPITETGSNATIQSIIEALITRLKAVTDSASGADLIGMTVITETGANATVQSIIEALITRLKATTDSASGADLIGATAIDGLTGGTVQALLEALDTALDTHKADETTAHGATANRTASKILLRDASGNAPANGVSFPATQSASADANTLDDYEEGTWTAGMTCGTSGTITMNNSYKTGTYTKIGRQVTVTGELVVDSVSSPVGDITLTGLPFACANSHSCQAAVSIAAFGLEATAVVMIQGRVQKNTSAIELFRYSGGSAVFDLAASIKAGSQFDVCVTYFV